MDKFAGNFRLLDVCDVSAIKDTVAALSEDDWNAVNWRQKRFEAHNHTQTIELIFDRDFRHENPTVHPKYHELGCDTLLAPVVDAISDYFTGEGYAARAILVNLKPGGEIPTHVDTGHSLMNSRRIHVAIISNDQVVFNCGNEKRVMKEGELWEINNARVHSVENRGEKGRVHLIVDWVPT
jgi:quercetin dioxygenase-like cupin family protein